MNERPGLVGQAHRGTLFLDEIGELSSESQAHLLRVLDLGEYQRLGEPTARASKFRLVAATNRDPAELKPDFRARFKVTVELPALRERREDIPLLLRQLVLNSARERPDLVGRFLAVEFDRPWSGLSVLPAAGAITGTAALVAALVTGSWRRTPATNSTKPAATVLVLRGSGLRLSAGVRSELRATRFSTLARACSHSRTFSERCLITSTRWSSS